jgi:hypothetical protein
MSAPILKHVIVRLLANFNEAANSWVTTSIRISGLYWAGVLVTGERRLLTSQ